MTGKDILAEEFEKAGMRGGYRAEQVDVFLQSVATYVDQINAKNDDLSYKLKLLADKIEEYKKDETSIRDALLGAQKLGASVLEEANLKAETLTREARQAADEMLSQSKSKIEALTKESLQKANTEINNAKRDCEREQKHLDSMKQEVSTFRSSILKQYKTHLDLLSNLPTIGNDDRKSDSQLPIFETAKQPEYQRSQNISENVSYTKLVVDETPLETTEPIPAPQTIKSEVLSTEDEIKNEERQQTKEFHSSRKPTISASEVNDRGNVSPAIPFNPPQKSSMAGKFAELDFGKNNDK